jgi:hypothetical protein
MTQVNYVSNLLQNSSEGINHYLTVEDNGRPAIDGLVAVFTVKITGYPEGFVPSTPFPSSVSSTLTYRSLSYPFVLQRQGGVFRFPNLCCADSDPSPPCSRPHPPFGHLLVTC